MNPHHRPRTLFKLTLTAIGLALVTAYFYPEELTTLPSEFTKPVLALEFVESIEQFTAITVQQTVRPAEQWASVLFWHGTVADMAFVAAYGILWLRLLMLAGGRRRKLVTQVGISAVMVAVAADYVENWGIIHGLHAATNHTLPPVDEIRIAATVKWLALGVVFLALVERFRIGQTTAAPVAAAAVAAAKIAEDQVAQPTADGRVRRVDEIRIAPLVLALVLLARGKRLRTGPTADTPTAAAPVAEDEVAAAAVAEGEVTEPLAGEGVWRGLNVIVAVAYAAAGALSIAGVLLWMGGFTAGPFLLELSPWAVGVALLVQLPLLWFAERYAPVPDDPTFTERIDAVRDRELQYIIRRRTQTAGQPPAVADVANTLVGLSLSGGGIRSATTNLGMLQALSRMGILPLVDYLSTVSGGGYIGGCLTSLLSIKADVPRPGHPDQFKYGTRANLRFDANWRTFPFNPEVRAAPGPCCDPPAKDSPGKQIVAHLRTHGNFLVARRGVFKRDALRAAGHLLTGTVYHVLTTLVLLFFAALVLMGIAHGIEPDLRNVLGTEVRPQYTELATVTPDSGANNFVVNQEQPIAWQRQFTDRFGWAWVGVLNDFEKSTLPRALGHGAVATLVVFGLFIVATWLPAWPKHWGAGETQEDKFARWMLNTAALVVVAAVAVSCLRLRRTDVDYYMGWVIQPFLVLAGARIASFLLYPVIVRAGLPRIKWVDLWSREFRSLWASFQAMTTYGMVGTLLFAMLPVLAYGAAQVSWWTLVAPAVSLAVSRVLVADAVGQGAARWKIPAGLLRFALGLSVVAFVTFIVVESAAIAVRFDFDQPSRACANRFIVALGLGGGALLFLSVAGDINRIGPHYFYRDRLLETYLRTEFPAADKRMVTFSDATSMNLTEMHGEDPSQPGALGNTAPYMLISAAINLAGSRDLTRKDRKSGYFLFSKYFCGSRQTGYRQSETWRKGETSVSRAMTISGAAVSTAMGSKTFFAEAFVTAMFNLRLGYWMSHPRTNTGDRVVFWPRYMFHEIFSTTSERKPLVNLSDGGHTGDNIGIYPLLERRCQVIIACDAEADVGVSFGSFTEALRHAYVDLGIDIDIDLSLVRRSAESGYSKSHCAIGRIRYPECPDRPNWLIYLKNSITGDEPATVMNYRSTCPDFPHESTADQFFDDAQFESYRSLGVHIAEGAFGWWAAQDDIATGLKNPRR